MTLKQSAGIQAPDGSHYVTIVDGAGNLTPLGTATPLGQATMAASQPVTIASDQSDLEVVLTTNYPDGAVPLTASTTGGTASVTATLAGTTGKTTYIAGFTVCADATSLTIGTTTVTGTVTGTLFYLQSVLAAASGVGILTQTYNPPIPASTTGTAISVASPTPGIGGNVSVATWGYQL